MVLVIHGGRVMGFWWGAWCTATKGSGIVVWGGGEILIKTYPGTNPCRLSPSPPHLLASSNPTAPPSVPRRPVIPRAHPSTQPSAASGSHAGNISADIPFARKVQFSVLRRTILRSRGAAPIRSPPPPPARTTSLPSERRPLEKRKAGRRKELALRVKMQRPRLIIGARDIN